MKNITKIIILSLFAGSMILLGGVLGYTTRIFHENTELKELRIENRELGEEIKDLRNYKRTCAISSDNIMQDLLHHENLKKANQEKTENLITERDSAIEERDFNYMRYLQESEKNQKLDVQVSTLLREKDAVRLEKESVESDLQKLRVHSNDQTGRIADLRKENEKLSKDIERLEQDIASLTRELNNIEICEN